MRVLFATVLLYAATASRAMAREPASTMAGDWQSGSLLFMLISLGLFLVFLAFLLARKDSMGSKTKAPPTEAKRPRLRGIDPGVRPDPRAGQRPGQDPGPGAGKGGARTGGPRQPGKPRR